MSYLCSAGVIFSPVQNQINAAERMDELVNSDTKFYDRESNKWVTQMLPLRYCIFDSYKKAAAQLLSQSKVNMKAARAVSPKSIQVSWEKLKHASAYRLVISTSSKFNRAKRQRLQIKRSETFKKEKFITLR